MFTMAMRFIFALEILIERFRVRLGVQTIIVGVGQWIIAAEAMKIEAIYDTSWIGADKTS